MDDLPVVAWIATPDGSMSYLSKAWRTLTGRDPRETFAYEYALALHPDDRARNVEAWARARASASRYRDEVRLRVADGSYRWFLSEAVPLRDAAGKVTGWCGTIVDVDEQHRLADAREMFVALVENSDDFVGISDLAGNVLYLNDAGRRMVEALPGGGPAHTREYFLPADREMLRTTILPAVAQNGRWAGDFRLRNVRTGKAIPVACTLFRIVGRSGDVLGVATVSRDRRRRSRFESGLRLLANTGGAALGSLDVDETLQNIARAFLEDFASYCIIDVRTADGGWHRTGVHRTSDYEPLLRNVSEPRADHPIARALRTGESSIVQVDDAWAESTDGAEDRAQVVRTLAVRSFITVPVIEPGGGISGALTCALDATSTRESYDDEDLGFVQEVGRRAGAAIANARLFDRQRRIAIELQAASLPTELPQQEGLFLDADYRPASDEATIGGDWFDAFRLDDGRVIITVGDVLGHGLSAAVTMTKLRQAMQSAAMVDPDPNVMLAVADKTLRLFSSDAYATAIAAVYDPESATLEFASAGHPGPALRTSDGTVEEFLSPGLMLGLRAGDERNTVTFGAPHEATLVFFTDGLVEATRDIAEGHRRLHEAMAQRSILEGPRPASALVDFVLGGKGASDDIAVLVARIRSPRPA